MKERPILFSGPMVRAIFNGRKTQTRRAIKTGGIPYDEFWAEQWLRKGKCPFGTPGDRLWVRETFVVDYEVGEGTRGEISPAVFYRATDDGNTNFTPGMEQWKPSIHMPRKFCRLLLDVKAIRVERLNDISEDDCKAEGCVDRGDSAGDEFAELWESINGKRGYGWKENPWVWVVEFERVQPRQAPND